MDTTLDNYSTRILTLLLLRKIEDGSLDNAVIDVASDVDLLAYFSEDIKEAVIKRFLQLNQVYR